MASHHFLGTGRVSKEMAALAGDPEELLDQVAERIADSGLTVMARQAVTFPGGGLTLVWVLAESHLVLHHWAAEGYATIDLHVCDYRGANAGAARRLIASLRRLCFAKKTDRWHEQRLDPPGGEAGAAVAAG